MVFRDDDEALPFVEADGIRVVPANIEADRGKVPVPSLAYSVVHQERADPLPAMVPVNCHRGDVQRVGRDGRQQALLERSPADQAPAGPNPARGQHGQPGSDAASAPFLRRGGYHDPDHAPVQDRHRGEVAAEGRPRRPERGRRHPNRGPLVAGDLEEAPRDLYQELGADLVVFPRRSPQNDAFGFDAHLTDRMHGGRMERETATRRKVILSLVVGLVAGFFSGLFGVGGGILVVPGLVLLMRMGQRRAHGTSLAAIVPIAISGVVTYALHDSVDWPVAGLLIVGAVGGAALGTRALAGLNQRVLRLAFATFLVATAIRLLLDLSHPAGRGPLDVWLALGLVAIGVVSGVLAGLLGVGGGIVIIPALVVLFAVPDVVAKGTSLAVIIPTALVGTLGNVRRSNADLSVAAIVGLVGAGSAWFGSHLSLHMSARLSSVLFGILLVLVALRMYLTKEPDSQTLPAG
jgi:uncharacterized protein